MPDAGGYARMANGSYADDHRSKMVQIRMLGNDRFEDAHLNSADDQADQIAEAIALRWIVSAQLPVED